MRLAPWRRPTGTRTFGSDGVVQATNSAATRGEVVAREYYELTEKPLGVIGEIAEYEVARILKLKLSSARQSGYDAIREVNGKSELLQIKGCPRETRIEGAKRARIAGSQSVQGDRLTNLAELRESGPIRGTCYPRRNGAATDRSITERPLV